MQELRRMIVKSDVVFHPDYWKNVSDDAKKFVLKLMSKNSKDRPEASAALNDPWMLHEEEHLSKFERSQDTTKIFRRTNARRKLMSVARAVIAMNRMKKLISGNIHDQTITSSVNNPMRH